MTVIFIFLEYILFFITILFSFYFPGKYIVSLFGKNFENANKSIIAWTIGYSVFLLLSYMSAWLHIVYLPLVGLGLLYVYLIFFRRKIFKLHQQRVPFWAVLLIVFGAVAFSSLSLLSGIYTCNGFGMIGSDNGTDAIMHIARIKTQLYAFPPVYTGFAGYVMRGYNYFYDFLLSRFTLFYHFSPEELYYRLFPLFISLFYGWALYVLSGQFVKQKSTKLLILFFAYFGASCGFLLSFFVKTINSGNGMGLVQQIELILDPSVILSAGLLFVGFYILLLKKKTLAQAIFVGIIVGLLMQLKVYAGIIGIGTVVIFSLYLLKKHKAWKYILVSSVLAIFLTAVTYLPSNAGAGKLIFSPFFLYANFMKQDLFTPLHWETRMILYTQQHKIIHSIGIYLLAGVIFWTLALGSRVLGVAYFLQAYRRNFWTEQNILLTSAITIPLLLASIFVQSISIFDTVQFFWFVAILMSIPAGIFYGKLFEKFSMVGKYFLVALVVFLSFGEVLYNEQYYIFHPYFMTIPSANLAVLRSVQARLSDKDFFVVTPSVVYGQDKQMQLISYPAPLFSALSGKRTYYEYEVPEFPIQNEVTLRKERIDTIAKAAEVCDGETINQTMHLVGSEFLVTTNRVSCQQVSHLQKIASSGEWTFWVVK